MKAVALSVSIIVYACPLLADFPASAYIQDGLVVQFDGIDNAGTGTHDSSATAWKDLVSANAGKYDMTLTAYGSFTDNALSANGTKTAAKGVSPDVAFGHIEGCYSLDSDVTKNSVMYSSGLTAGNNKSMDWLIGLLSDHRGGIFGDETPMFSIGDDYRGFHTLSTTRKICYYDGSVDGVTKNGNNYFGVTDARQSGISAVGGFGDDDSPCAVKMHAIRIYNRELTAAEVAYNANIDKIRFKGADPAELTWPEGVRWDDTADKMYVKVSVKATPGLATFTMNGAEAELEIDRWVEQGSCISLSPIKSAVVTGWSGHSPTPGEKEGEYEFIADFPISSSVNLDSSVFNVVELVALARKKSEYREISASSSAGGNYPAIKAFDGSTIGNSAAVWHSKTRTELGEAFSDQWIQHRFTDKFEPGKNIFVVSYGFAGVNNGDSLDNRPKTWELLASNDGEDWTVIDSRTYDWSVAAVNFPCKVLGAFRYFRLRMTETRSASAKEYKINDLYLYGIVTDKQDPFEGYVLWKGDTVGNWKDDASWSTGRAPQAGEKVFLLCGNTITVDESTPLLSEVVLGGTIVMKGWDTVFNAANIVVHNIAKITCEQCTTTSDPSNRVWIACNDLVVEKGGSIDVQAKGYSANNGPGKADSKSVGASHAGHGGYPYMMSNGTASSRVIYGDAQYPQSIGSGGSKRSGGGVIRVDASGIVVVNGVVTAAGGNSSDFKIYNSGGNHDGAGSGGSILITCRDFAGANGTVSVAGGGGRIKRDDNGNFYNDGMSAPGGGGRIAIHKTGSCAALISGMTFDAAAGTMHGGTYTSTNTYFDSTLATEDIRHCNGGPGSLWFSDMSFLKALDGDGTLSGQLRGLPLEVSFDSITLNGGIVRFAAEGSIVNVAGDVTLNGANARLEIGGDVTSTRTRNPEYNSGIVPARLNVGGDINLVGGARLDIRSAMTNSLGGADGAYGAFVDVTGTLNIADDSCVYVWSDVETGCSPLIRAKNIYVAQDAKVSADHRGFGAGWSFRQSVSRLYCGYGPGADKLGYSGSNRIVAGGGHGGMGGNWSPQRGGEENDDKFLPLLPGSGGSCPFRYGVQGGNGGGAVNMIATESIVIDGTVSANGESCSGDSTSGGAGGTIFLSAPSVSGSETAVLSARGADMPSGASLRNGAGGGGRIAIWTGLGWQPRLRRSQLTRSENEPLVSWIGGPVFEGMVDVSGGTSPHAATNSAPVGIEGSLWYTDVKEICPGMRIIVR